jgi:hypothetical protein
LDPSFAKAALFVVGLISLLVVGWSIKSFLHDKTKDHEAPHRGAEVKLTWVMLLIGFFMIFYGLFILFARIE